MLFRSSILEIYGGRNLLARSTSYTRNALRYDDSDDITTCILCGIRSVALAKAAMRGTISPGARAGRWHSMPPLEDELDRRLVSQPLSPPLDCRRETKCGSKLFGRQATLAESTSLPVDS